MGVKTTVAHFASPSLMACGSVCVVCVCVCACACVCASMRVWRGGKGGKV